MNPSCLRYAAYVPSGPPPGLSEFVADCRERQRQLLWARHDKRTRRWASELVRQAWHTMRYINGAATPDRRRLPEPPVEPEQLDKLRPERATGLAIEALAVAIRWAETQARDPRADGTNPGSPNSSNENPQA